MSATYDPTLATDADWVRFHTGDVNVASAVLSDEEIAAVLADIAADNGASGIALRLLAAVRCLESAQARAFAKSAGSGGLSEKTVEGLTLKWGVDASTVGGWRSKIDDLRRQAAFHLAPKGSRVLCSL